MTASAFTFVPHNPPFDFATLSTTGFKIPYEI